MQKNAPRARNAESSHSRRNASRHAAKLGSAALSNSANSSVIGTASAVPRSAARALPARNHATDSPSRRNDSAAANGAAQGAASAERSAVPAGCTLT